MGKKHLKRLNSPRTWHILRKVGTFITRSYPGRNTQDFSVPLGLFFKDMVKLAHTTKEVKKMLHSEEVLVDGKRVRDVKNPVEFMDIITLPSTKAAYRICLDNHGRLVSKPVDEKEQNLKLCRIIGKTKIKGGKTQLNLNDARNVLVDKEEYKVGDSLLIEVPSQKIQQHFALKVGVPVILIGGKHVGQTVTIESVEGDNVKYRGEKESSLTLKKYAFVVGKEKPAIAL